MEQYFQNKYFTIEKLQQSIPHFDMSTFELLTTDSYSDEQILKSIQRTKSFELLMLSAIQTAVVGFGNKNYGQMKYKNEIIDICELYKILGVKTDLSFKSVIAPDILTPRRLQRFFRFEIRKYLELHDGIYTYLFKKYSSHNEAFRCCTYPGAESLVTDKSEAENLLETYVILDKKVGSNITDRIIRVLSSRGIFSFKECTEKVKVMRGYKQSRQ